VWRRDGDLRELPISDGWNVLDDNLLACSDEHIRAVFDMLARQPRRPEFTGGLEAKRILPWHAEALRRLRPKQLFFAFDEPGDYEPLRKASIIMRDSGFTAASHVMRCYVLCGHPSDTMRAADARMRMVLALGMTPMAMLWRNDKGDRWPEWARFQRAWARPAIVHGGEK
jgi:hypothetical protein